MSKKYKSVFFDLDNTLWDFERNSKETLRLIFNQYGIENPLCTFKSFHVKYCQINDLCWQAYRDKTLTKQELIVKRFQDTFDYFSLSGIDPLKFNNDYLDEMPNQTQLVEGAIELLEYLARKKYRLYIITNGFIEVQNNKLKKTNLDNYFKKVFISEEIRAPKPNKEIFEYAIKSTNSSKKDSIMIGDSWESDILGAKNFGIDQIYYQPTSKGAMTMKEPDQLKNQKTKTYCIDKLKQIMDIL